MKSDCTRDAQARELLLAAADLLERYAGMLDNRKSSCADCGHVTWTNYGEHLRLAIVGPMVDKLRRWAKTSPLNKEAKST